MCCTPSGGGIASFRRRPWCRNTSPLPWPAPARRAQRQRAGSERQARSARRVLDRCFEALCVEGRHTLDPPQTLGRVPDGEREHRFRIRGINNVDEIVVALRVVDRLDLDTQIVELCLGVADPLRLLARPLWAQITKQHIFHGNLHVILIIVREGPHNYTPSRAPANMPFRSGYVREPAPRGDCPTTRRAKSKTSRALVTGPCPWSQHH